MNLDIKISKKQKAFIESQADETLFGGAARWSARVKDSL